MVSGWQSPGEDEGKYRVKPALLEALRESHNESQMEAVQVRQWGHWYTTGAGTPNECHNESQMEAVQVRRWGHCTRGYCTPQILVHQECWYTQGVPWNQ